MIFGDYRILRPLGQGGMGSVYLALQLSTGRKRALKVLLPEQHQNPRIREQFIAEARIAAALDSDHVADVIAAGIDPESGSPWMALEYLEGETLEARVKRAGRLAPSEVQEIMRQICHAIGQAHSAGLVHRDLKPANLFVADPRRDGVPFTLKVLDFGIATLVEGRARDSMSQPIGSPRWMAPEQSEPHHASPATDVWALGLVAYYCLVGRTLWESAANQCAPSLAEIFGDIPKASDRAREHGVSLPSGFDAWFERCVVRDPARRFPDAWHVLHALASWESPALDRMAAPPQAAPSAPAPSARVTWSAAPLAAPGDTRVTAPPTMPAGQSGAPVTGGGTYAPVLADNPARGSTAPVGRAVATLMLIGSLAALGLLALAVVVGLYVFVSPDLLSGGTRDGEQPSPAAAPSSARSGEPSATAATTATTSASTASPRAAVTAPRTAPTTSVPKRPDAVVATPDETPTAGGLAPFDRARATAKVKAAAGAAASQCKAHKNPDAGVETFTGTIGFRPDGTTSKFQTGVGAARSCVSKVMSGVSYGEYRGPPGTDPSVHLEDVSYSVSVQ